MQTGLEVFQGRDLTLRNWFLSLSILFMRYVDRF